jgi:hypothetical protein
MRYLFGFMCVLALGVMGCGETAGDGGSGGSGGTAGTGGSAGTGGTGGQGGTAAEPVPLSVFMTSYEPPTLPGVVEGMRICELETANCAVTDEGGLATLEASAEQEIALTMEKEGFGPYIYTYAVPAKASQLLLGNATDARFEEMFGLVMSPYPMEGTGSIWVSGSPEGAMLTLLGATGKAFYADDDVKASWSLDLTAATANGGGGFVEVPAGEYQVEVTGTSKSCFPVRGWPGDSENTVRMPVREGYLSSARMLCD